MSTHGLTLRARGMHCTGCEHIIEDSVRRLAGVTRVKADYPTESVAVVFDPRLTHAEDICAAIARKGYRCTLADEVAAPRSRLRKVAGALSGVVGILLIIYLDTRLISTTGTPDVSQHMGYGLILLLGLVTGFHCIGMCGGFVLSYTTADAAAGASSYGSHALYGAGKTFSYTSIGALFGLVGAIVTFTPLLRGIAGVGAGLFLIVFGLNMLGLLAPLRQIRLALPASLELFIGKHKKQNFNRPFLIGALNGLNIACGPLQAMYVMAAGTGSAIEGAKMLFTFGIGTLPVLLSFGVLTTLISASLTHRLLKASGVILVILGAVMINRGLILTGTGHDLQSIIHSLRKTDAVPALAPMGQEAVPTVQTITMSVVASGFSPNRFTLRKGVPVEWVINGDEITSCNRRIIVPSLGLEFDVREGRQVIEFTPEKAGVIPWSCWMGMLHGSFEVIEDGPGAPPVVAAAEPIAPPAAAPPAADEPPAAPHGQAEATEAAPAPRASAGEDIAKAPPVPVETYRVVAGDTLRRIAARLYREPQEWRRILQANPGLDPRRLKPGQVINLPRPARHSS